MFGKLILSCLSGRIFLFYLISRAATQLLTEWSIHFKEESPSHSTLTTPIFSWWMMGHRASVELRRFSSERDWRELSQIKLTLRNKVSGLAASISKTDLSLFRNRNRNFLRNYVKYQPFPVSRGEVGAVFHNWRYERLNRRKTIAVARVFLLFNLSPAFQIYV